VATKSFLTVFWAIRRIRKSVKSLIDGDVLKLARGESFG
jgi:hypothetical protein